MNTNAPGAAGRAPATEVPSNRDVVAPTPSPHLDVVALPCAPTDSLLHVRAGDWDLDALVERMQRARITLPASELRQWRPDFLDAAQTEFDAEHLRRYLKETGMPLTPEFRAFERAWRRDEHRHYLGFRRLFARLYPEAGEAGIVATVARGVPDFAPIAELLTDEFHLLAAIAFDEACTAKSYGEQIAFYERLGDPVFAEWIRHVTRDEVNHMLNAIDVLRARHAARLDEMGPLLDRFVAHDLHGPGYRNTFLFDHDTYAPDLIVQAAARLKRRFAR